MAGTGSTPCASCKLLRRRCTKECVFAPHFPPEDPHKFAIVHKVFGASNVSKMLQELPAPQRADAVSSLVYEANARIRDPVYGCVGAISYLQHQVSQLQMQLAVAKAEILCIQHVQHDGHPPAAAAAAALQQLEQQMDGKAYNNLIVHNALTNTLSTTAARHQLMGFGSAGSAAVVLQEACLEKESLWTR